MALNSRRLPGFDFGGIIKDPYKPNFGGVIKPPPSLPQVGPYVPSKPNNPYLDAITKPNYGLPSTPSTSGGSSSSGSSSGGGGGGYYVPQIDFGIFEQMRQQAQQGFSNAQNSLKEQMELLRNSLNKQRKRGSEQFASGRGNIAENAYDKARAEANALASRGLASSGLQDLAKVQQAMEQGQQVSGLANQYYDFTGNLMDKEAEANSTYQSNLSNLQNQLTNALNQIGMQEFGARNDYNAQLANAANARAIAERASSTSGSSQELQALSNAVDMINMGFTPEQASKYTGVPTNQLSQFGKKDPTASDVLNNIITNTAGMSKKDRDALINPYLEANAVDIYGQSGGLSPQLSQYLNPPKQNNLWDNFMDFANRNNPYYNR